LHRRHKRPFPRLIARVSGYSRGSTHSKGEGCFPRDLFLRQQFPNSPDVSRSPRFHRVPCPRNLRMASRDCVATECRRSAALHFSHLTAGLRPRLTQMSPLRGSLKSPTLPGACAPGSLRCRRSSTPTSPKAGLVGGPGCSTGFKQFRRRSPTETLFPSSHADTKAPLIIAMLAARLKPCLFKPRSYSELPRCS